MDDLTRNGDITRSSQHRIELLEQRFDGSRFSQLLPKHPGLARLSGSCNCEVEDQLPRVERWRKLILSQPRHVFAMHEIDAHESNKFESAMSTFRHLPQQMQEKKGNQRDGDLNAHRILGTAEEMLDLQGLLHETEEELDLPASFIEISDFLRRRVEVIGEDPQLLGPLGHNADLA